TLLPVEAAACRSGRTAGRAPSWTGTVAGGEATPIATRGPPGNKDSKPRPNARLLSGDVLSGTATVSAVVVILSPVTSRYLSFCGKRRTCCSRQYIYINRYNIYRHVSI